MVTKNGQGTGSLKALWCRDNAVKLRAAIEAVSKYWNWTFQRTAPLYAWTMDGWWCKMEDEQSVGEVQRMDPRDLQRPEPLRMSIDLASLD